ncbi:GNAT family N-acetyltransferase [Phenylobacterium deserti]|uniref:N-acetyltransferase n=1 Tax=Phenylobacterium deserti TaxID=1914756 RepID=A0A328AAB0_9CAUL|nr:GNAT family N-acetyltransferase [Phenylobacterium deserti]RAK51495.1 N-acetyltransferase [Phenylobacterium deserti]
MSESLSVHQNEGAMRFEVVLGGETAYAEYRLRDDVVILPHTVVPEAFEGRGVGSKLARAALDWAREQGLKVIPSCPFISAYVAKHPEYHDLVDDSYREQLGLER